jgi:hypothetical protein
MGYGSQRKRMPDRGNDVAQVCVNGHVITSMYEFMPEHRQDFCDECGERTITSCLHCATNIKGASFAVLVLNFKVPLFCLNCGKPFPWTEARIEAAKEFAQELALSVQDIESVTQDIEQLVRDTPRTIVAATRFKRIVGQAGVGTLDSFRDILIGIVVEGARRIIWP